MQGYQPHCHCLTVNFRHTFLLKDPTSLVHPATSQQCQKTMNITTFAEENLGFVPEPDGRGTLGLLWSSVAVLFLNTWTVLHLNIQDPNQGFWRGALYRTKWMIIATIAPEFICLMAAHSYDAAKTLQRLMQGRVQGWSMTHGYYANMGGFKVSCMLIFWSEIGSISSSSAASCVQYGNKVRRIWFPRRVS